MWILASKTAVVWVLQITLSSAPTEPSYYEFLSQEDCQSVIPAVTELYKSLGEREVNATCYESVQETKTRL